ncbi:hypothetical protein EVB97_279 [Rhizobium phage RHph_Y65]|uniref:Uncharacterized protein n=1 Tax=Rhizobium phage RHph_Y65 TaxID=2509785 RepID=A0A7S5R821_9CAUD|nr:hypothetical protein PQC17_gp363 [Rhizobium phage RHph_Y65]QIG72110.1 hypothetical protein EVB95_277 [Rhizobium phage RHph_TM2_3B]QIG72472.1 hypothetical protein EVB96_277 [Rhizobium phage RHph_TM3_3_6]QIG72836.1 hypothetical protein EVB97_279 [Rhizobium phage RHph_Y65]QIG77543.1 hypothetical protein EVB61_217 [Rhizobium phage RHph_TM21B]
MDKFNRAVRRHHRKRLRENRKIYHGGLQWVIDREKAKSFRVNTPTPCSCHMCGNPRKFFKELTIQERKFALHSAKSGLTSLPCYEVEVFDLEEFDF